MLPAYQIIGLLLSFFKIVHLNAVLGCGRRKKKEIMLDSLLSGCYGASKQLVLE